MTLLSIHMLFPNFSFLRFAVFESQSNQINSEYLHVRASQTPSKLTKHISLPPRLTSKKFCTDRVNSFKVKKTTSENLGNFFERKSQRFPLAIVWQEAEQEDSIEI